MYPGYAHLARQEVKEPIYRERTLARGEQDMEEWHNAHQACIDQTNKSGMNHISIDRIRSQTGWWIHAYGKPPTGQLFPNILKHLEGFALPS